jgi:hypothetical protein
MTFLGVTSGVLGMAVLGWFFWYGG